MALTHTTLALKSVQVTADYKIKVDDMLIVVDASSGNVTLTLPAINSLVHDAVYWIKRIDDTVNVVTVQAAGGETIDGDITNTSFSQYTALGFHCDNVQSEYHII